ncbi:hypothetical protein DSECCO2_472680 [anaerobic digester metagenome]
MSKEGLIIGLNEVIALLEEILSKESFSAYKKLIKKYTATLKTIERKPIESINEGDFKLIIDSTRIIWEAPPKDEVLGDKLVEKDKMLWHTIRNLLA